jgi:hypothetical protein
MQGSPAGVLPGGQLQVVNSRRSPPGGHVKGYLPSCPMELVPSRCSISGRALQGTIWGVHSNGSPLGFPQHWVHHRLSPSWAPYSFTLPGCPLQRGPNRGSPPWGSIEGSTPSGPHHDVFSLQGAPPVVPLHRVPYIRSPKGVSSQGSLPGCPNKGAHSMGKSGRSPGGPNHRVPLHVLNTMGPPSVSLKRVQYIPTSPEATT